MFINFYLDIHMFIMKNTLSFTKNIQIQLVSYTSEVVKSHHKSKEVFLMNISSKFKICMF